MNHSTQSLKPRPTYPKLTVPDITVMPKESVVGGGLYTEREQQERRGLCIQSGVGDRDSYVKQNSGGEEDSM